MTVARIVARTETGMASFVVNVPPSASDLDRQRQTAECPGLADAVWTAEEDKPRR